MTRIKDTWGHRIAQYLERLKYSLYTLWTDISLLNWFKATWKQWKMYLENKVPFHTSSLWTGLVLCRDTWYFVTCLVSPAGIPCCITPPQLYGYSCNWLPWYSGRTLLPTSFPFGDMFYQWAPFHCFFNKSYFSKKQLFSHSVLAAHTQPPTPFNVPVALGTKMYGSFPSPSQARTLQTLVTWNNNSLLNSYLGEKGKQNSANAPKSQVTHPLWFPNHVCKHTLLLCTLHGILGWVFTPNSCCWSHGTSNNWDLVPNQSYLEMVQLLRVSAPWWSCPSERALHKKSF